jgi:acyl transferase domain-containing protein/acyl carrier protein
MTRFNLAPNLDTPQRVLLALKEARAKLQELEQPQEIAIVGMAGRFPGADSVEQFWDNLCQGVNAIQVNVPAATDESPRYVNAYSSMADFDRFDAAFFGYSPREAELLDPQHRVFLECAWSALENAGYDPQRYPGSIAVYAGAALNSYLINLHTSPLSPSVDRVQAVVSNVMGLMPTRVSYKLNLRGPSCGIQTGCSTSLVAVHIACQSLLNQECDMALAGGVAIDASNHSGYSYQEDGVMSPDGYCRAFDAAAQGTVFGNGVGIVVLKKLSTAIADGDFIYAVIKGSAINNDGSEKVGLTAPSVSGQAAVISAALNKAGISADTIQYLEAHGTGTALGDPIEIAALTKAFRSQTDRRQFCAIGSVKTNIGHLDAAAGVTGLIKTALALKHQQIPPSLNFQTPNPQIDFAHSPFFVNTHLTPWRSNSPRCAAISSFGMGGTNAHLILESCPNLSPHSSRSHHLLLLSAKTPAALTVSVNHLQQHLQRHSDQAIADVAYTLQIGRQPFDYRVAVVVQDHSSAISALEQCPIANIQPTVSHRVAFLFPGQGSQYAQMGRELYESEPEFRTEIDRCYELLLPELDLRDRLFSSDPGALVPTALAQPALFVLEYALAQLWQSWGVRPEAMIGHSIGEFVAACLAGVMTLEEALKLVVWRGKLMQSCEPGAMLSVALPAAQVKPLLFSDLTLAAINAPKLCVVSGSATAIATLEQQLSRSSVVSRRLQTSHAFHSASMEPIVSTFIDQVRQIKLSPPQIPLISNVTGTWMTTEQATDPTYWGQQLRQTVMFAAGLETLMQKPHLALLEVGAGRTLSTLTKRINPTIPVFYSLRHPQEKTPDQNMMLNTLGNLWKLGLEVNWSSFYAAEKRQRLPLPTYPFERQRYWIDLIPQPIPTSVSQEPLIKHPDVSHWFYTPSWKRVPLESTAHEILSQCWLVFKDQSLFSQTFIERLKLDHTVVTIGISDRFTCTDQHYTLCPNQPDHYDLLIQSLQERNLLPQRVVHLWSLQEPQFSSLVFLARSLPSHPLHLAVVTPGIHDITGSEALDPMAAIGSGACQVISQEYPHIQVASIDLIIPSVESHLIQKSVDQLVLELVNPIPDRVAYRGYHRWLQSFEPIALSSSQSMLRQAGNYLIAGDLVEGLGLIFAQHLVNRFQAKLVLLGRAGLPQPADWDYWLNTHAPQDPISRCLRTLQNLSATHEVEFYSVDLGDAAQVQTVAAQVLEKYGTLHGVFHTDTMGDRASCLIADLTPQIIDCQFRSKIQGVLNLEQSFRGSVTDFYLLQSSLSTLAGGVGFAAYAAANHFLDHFAQSRQDAVPWVSVNWDACRLDSPDRPTGQTLLDLALTPSEVWQATERILSRPDLPQVVVSPADLSQRLHHAPALSSHDRPPVSTPYIAPRNDIEQTVAIAMQELLGIEQIGMDDNFFELGGHSLLAIQAVTRLRQTFQVELPMREFLFESPTVAGIAKVIADNLDGNAAMHNQQEILKLLEQVEAMESERIDEPVSLPGGER